MWLEYSDGFSKTAMPQESILYTRGLFSLQCIDRSVQSWLGHATHASTYGLRRSVFSAIAFRVVESSGLVRCSRVKCTLGLKREAPDPDW
jgi:hypothetical protein